MNNLFLALCIVIPFAAGFLPAYLIGRRVAANRTLQMLDELQQTFDREDG